jgi:hypothetical protein
MISPGISTSFPTARSSLFPPPLRGRVREGGDAHLDLSGWGTPLSNSPPQGGTEQAVRGVRPQPNGEGCA